MIRQILKNEETTRDGIFRDGAWLEQPGSTKGDVCLIGSDSMGCHPGEQLYRSINKSGPGRERTDS